MPLEAIPSSVGCVPPGETALDAIARVLWSWLICMQVPPFCCRQNERFSRPHCSTTLSQQPSLSIVGLDHDRPGRAVNRHAAAGRYPLSCALHAHHCGNTVLTGHNRAVRHRSTHFHHQSRCLEKQRGPTRIGRGRDQDLARRETRIMRITDHARDRRHPSCRRRGALQCPRCLDSALAFLRLSERFGAIREQDEGHMTAPEFPREGDSPLAHTLPQVRSGKQRVCLGKREEEEISGLVQPPGLGCCLSDRPEEGACLSQNQSDDKARHLAKAGEGVGAFEAEAHQPPAQPVLVPGALGKRGDHRLCLMPGALELEVRRGCALLHVQVAGKERKHVAGVCRSRCRLCASVWISWESRQSARFIWVVGLVGEPPRTTWHSLSEASSPSSSRASAKLCMPASITGETRKARRKHRSRRRSASARWAAAAPRASTWEALRSCFTKRCTRRLAACGARNACTRYQGKLVRASRSTSARPNVRRDVVRSESRGSVASCSKLAAAWTSASRMASMRKRRPKGLRNAAVTSKNGRPAASMMKRGPASGSHGGEPISAKNPEASSRSAASPMGVKGR